MPWVMELLFALGRDDLRVVRYGCGSVRQDYPLFEHPAFSCDFLAAHTYENQFLTKLTVLTKTKTRNRGST